MEHNRIAELRRRAGITQRELADRLGITQQAVWYYENGRREIKSGMLIAMSEALGCTVSELLGLEPSEGVVLPHVSEISKVPIVGRIAAGTPREAFAQSSDYCDTPSSLVEGRSGCFWLVIAGNSMNRIFPDGALVLIDPSAEVRNGDVAAVFVNGDDATIKRVYFEGDSVRLHPESWDPEYKDRIIDRSDPEAPEFRTIGRAVSYTAPEGWRA